MTPVPLGPDDVDAALAVIVEQQARPERLITALGTEIDGIRAELADLDVDWTTTAYAIRDEGRVIGLAAADIDVDQGKAWILGPWVSGDDDAWDEHARPLLDAVLAALPAAVTRYELAGHTAHERLAALAADLGWEPTHVVHALEADEATAARWPTDPAGVTLRALEPGDVEAVRPLHDAEFPATHTSAETIAGRVAEGSWTGLVASTTAGQFAGYAAGRVQPDGGGYLDYVAVAPAARGHGTGRALVIDISRRLLAQSTTGQVTLTVDDLRRPARSLYEALGFRTDLSFRAYRNPPEGRTLTEGGTRPRGRVQPPVRAGRPGGRRLRRPGAVARRWPDRRSRTQGR